MPSIKHRKRKRHPLARAIIAFAILAAVIQPFGIWVALNQMTPPPPEIIERSVFAGTTINWSAVQYYQDVALLVLLAWITSPLKYVAFAIAFDLCTKIADIVLKRPEVVRHFMAQRPARADAV